MPEVKQKQPQDRKTVFETLSLPVAKILSPVARQAPTKFWTPRKYPQNAPKMPENTPPKYHQNARFGCFSGIFRVFSRGCRISGASTFFQHFRRNPAISGLCKHGWSIQSGTNGKLTSKIPELGGGFNGT